MPTKPSQNAKGIVLMVAAMAAFAVADTLIKIATSTLSPAHVMFFLMTGGLLVFSCLALAQRQKLADHRALAPAMLLRYVSEIVAMIGMVMSLRYVPISIVGAIIQATPLLVALGAVLWLGESVSWRRWSAIIVGFLGVLLIIQPGGEGFELSVLWAVVAMIGLSVRDLTTRAVPDGMGSASVAAYSMVAAIPFALGWIFLSEVPFVPEDANWLLVVFMVLIGSFGYVLLINSIRVAEISVVTPYRYSRLLFLLGIGVVLFDERPNVPVLIGAGLIVVSGLYTMWRERAATPSENEPAKG